MLTMLGCPVCAYLDTFAYAQAYKKANPDFDVDHCFKKGGFLPLSHYKKLIPPNAKIDYLIIEQNGFWMKNDVDIPVIYYHRDVPTPLFMLDADILLYRFKVMERTIANDHPEVWANGSMKARWLNGAEIYEFLHDKKKDLKGINWIGWGRPFEYYWQFPDQIEYYKFARYIAEESSQKGLVVRHKAPIPYPQYKDILQRSEGVLIVPGNEAYVTRKIYEAAVSKTLIVLWCQNKEAFEVYKSIGLIPNQNCVMFKTLEHLQEIYNKWDKLVQKKVQMVKNAFEWVITHHTWLNRARELLSIIEKYEARDK